MSIIIQEIASQSELEECLKIRRIGFIEGQNVPENEEVDGLDPRCKHYIALIEARAAGTARICYVGGG